MTSVEHYNLKRELGLSLKRLESFKNENQKLRDKIKELEKRNSIIKHSFDRTFNVSIDNSNSNVQSVLRGVIEMKYGVDISIPLRKREIVQGRQIYHHWLCFNTNMSLKEIGSYLSGYDHSTVINSRETINDLLESDKKLREQYKEIDEAVRKVLNASEEPVINAS